MVVRTKCQRRAPPNYISNIHMGNLRGSGQHMQIARLLTAASGSRRQVHPPRIPQAQAIAQQISRALHLQDERKANEDE